MRTVLFLILFSISCFAENEVKKISEPSNSLIVLFPYKYGDVWVFDDPSCGLKKEPFVEGIPDMINSLIKNIPDAENGFKLIVSAVPFPNFQTKLEWVSKDEFGTGNWYYSKDYEMNGWLCPALFKYFSEAPKEIYVKAEKK